MAKDKSKSGRKIGRNKKYQAAAYRSGARLEINRKKRWRRVLRTQPLNQQLRRRYEAEHGPYQGEPSPRALRQPAVKRRRAEKHAAKPLAAKLEAEVKASA